MERVIIVKLVATALMCGLASEARAEEFPSRVGGAVPYWMSLDLYNQAALEGGWGDLPASTHVARAYDYANECDTIISMAGNQATYPVDFIEYAQGFPLVLIGVVDAEATGAQPSGLPLQLARVSIRDELGPSFLGSATSVPKSLLLLFNAGILKVAGEARCRGFDRQPLAAGDEVVLFVPDVSEHPDGLEILSYVSVEVLVQREDNTVDATWPVSQHLRRLDLQQWPRLVDELVRARSGSVARD